VPARDNTVPTNFFILWDWFGRRRSFGIAFRAARCRIYREVVEPFNAGVSNIVSMTRLPMSGTANESVGLKIVFKDGRVDTYIVNLRNPQVAGATAVRRPFPRLTANTL